MIQTALRADISADNYWRNRQIASLWDQHHFGQKKKRKKESQGK